MDIDISRYWTINIITNPIDSNGRLTRGYTDRKNDLAKKFFGENFPELFGENFPEQSMRKTLSKQAHKNIQLSLWEMFYDNTRKDYDRAYAGLCLRCYISHAITKTCILITSSTFGTYTPRPFTYHDLLPYVLNDDGKTLIILDSNGSTPFILHENNRTQPVPNKGNYQSVKILRTYNPKFSKRESLDNWTIRCTQQNKELKNFLLEYRVKVPSDWSLLCKDIPHSLKSHLQNGDHEILEVFHQVYRRDRLYLGQTGKCTNPTTKQLKEMLCSLQKLNITLNSHQELILRLRDIAYILRQDMYSRKLGAPQAESIDAISQPDDDNYSSQFCLPPGDNLDPVSAEWQALLNEVNDLFIKVLCQAIEKIIYEKISGLKKTRKYTDFETQFLKGLKEYYCESNPSSITEIAKSWNMDKSQAIRIFKLKKFIKDIENLTIQKLIEELIKEKQKIEYSPLNCIYESLEDNKLDSIPIATELKEYIHQMAFKEAFAEISSGRYPSRNSLFAQKIRHYLESHLKL